MNHWDIKVGAFYYLQHKLGMDIKKYNAREQNSNKGNNELSDILKSIRELALELKTGEYTRAEIVKLIAEDKGKKEPTVYGYFKTIALKDSEFAKTFGYDSNGNITDSTRSYIRKPTSERKPRNSKKQQEIEALVAQQKRETEELAVSKLLPTFKKDIIEEQDDILISEVQLDDDASNMTRDYQEIVNVFTERWHRPSAEELEALQEQYLIITNRGQDALIWLTTLIKEIAKKSPEKRAIGYLISVIRNRLRHGWGVLRSEEEEMIIKEVEAIVNKELSSDERGIIYRLMGQYGQVKLSLQLLKVDLAKVYLEVLDKNLKNIYSNNNYSSNNNNYSTNNNTNFNNRSNNSNYYSR